MQDRIMDLVPTHVQASRSLPLEVPHVNDPLASAKFPMYAEVGEMQRLSRLSWVMDDSGVRIESIMMQFVPTLPNSVCCCRRLLIVLYSLQSRSFFRPRSHR